jgi:hypothetical protein
VSFGGLHWWNFWGRIDGALYLLRGTHPRSGRVIRAYAGKTFQHPWTKRIDQHLWGRGRYGNPAQPWADTILGWTPGGTVDQVIAAGGCRLVWHGRCSPFGLWWREILVIWVVRPKYNYQWNRGNRSRIEKYKATDQRAQRDQRRTRVAAATVAPGVSSSIPVSVAQRRAAFAGAGLAGVVLVPGGPGVVVEGVRWGVNNALGLVALLAAVVAVVAVWVVPKQLRARKG